VKVSKNKKLDSRAELKCGRKTYYYKLIFDN
jgi:hypothetical protein